MNAHGRCVSRLQVLQDLASDMSDQQLRNRIGCLERLHADISKYVRWPALEESLRQDAQALRGKLLERATSGA